MKAKSRSFTFLGNEALIRVPFFQRQYVWDKDNWEDLLGELSNINKSHFLGSIILKQQTTATGDTKEALIIDGQQRLTTLSILLKALYDSLADSVKKNVETPIRNCLFYKKEQTDTDFLVKIQHSLVDSVSFEKVMRAGLDGVPSLGAEESKGNKILECYGYFLEELGKREPKEVTALFNWITKNENEILVVIDLFPDDDEQAIFDTINSAGVRLSSADIVKNALFQRVIQIEGQKNAIEFYNATWGSVLVGNSTVVKFWEKQRATGRLKRDNLELLLHSVAVIKGIYNPEEHTLSDLAWLYKEYIAKLNTAIEIREFVKEVTDYAIIYHENIPTFEKDTLFSFDDYEIRLFHVLDSLEISTFNPFILQLYKKFANNEAHKRHVFGALESFVVRRVISKYEVKSFNKFCKEFIDNHDSLFERLNQTNEADFLAQLKNISKNGHATLLLFWIELRRRQMEPKNDLVELKDCYSLEHLMPQSWMDHWPLNVRTHPNGTMMTQEEAEADRWEKIYWLGNMTLLKTSLNSSLKNFKYEVKMVGDGRKKGIKEYADLRITRVDLVTPFDKGDNTWDEQKIVNRTQALIGEINAIWKKDMAPTPV